MNSNLVCMKIDGDTIEKYSSKLLIYRIYNNLDGKSYIGKCSKGLSRVAGHFIDWKYPKKQYRAKLLYRAINKHGPENFRWEILVECTSLEELDKKEIEFISMFRTIDPEFGYNLTAGGTGGNSWSWLTDEEKAKVSKKISEGNKKNYQNNPERKLESANTLRATRKDPIKSAKNKAVCSDRLKNLNKKDPRFMGARKLKVMCLENGKEYASLKDASADTGIGYGTISTAIKNNRKCKGLTFKFV